MGYPRKAFLLLSSAGVIAACSAAPGSIAESDVRGGLPPEAIAAVPEHQVGDLPTVPGPVAGWLDQGTKFAVVLSGSSSCPAFPSSIEVPSPQRIKLKVEIRGAQACTADMAPRTYVIKTPDGVDVASGVTLEYGEVTVTLPALPPGNGPAP